MNENPFDKKPKIDNLNQNKEQLKATIEVAKPEDWERVKNLRLAAIKGKDAQMFGVKTGVIQEEQRWTEEEWKKILSKNNDFTMLSKVDSEDIGMIRAYERKNGIWHLAWAYIKDEEGKFRGKGLGKALYEAPIEKIKELGVKKVTAFIYKNNPASFHIAESIGFKKIPLFLSDHTISKKIKAFNESFIPVELDLTKKETK